MPTYRTPHGWMHLKMAKRSPVPKHCRCALGPGLGLCMAMAGKLCDYPVGDGTCDMPVCDDHATSVGPDRDYCPRHAVADPPKGEQKGLF
jgi:hypothetical protein